MMLRIHPRNPKDIQVEIAVKGKKKKKNLVVEEGPERYKFPFKECHWLDVFSHSPQRGLPGCLDRHRLKIKRWKKK